MARERMVTRTVELTEVTYMTVNIVTAEVCNITVNISGNYDNAGLLKYAEKHFASDEVKYVAVVSTETKEVLYGMPESQFIELASILPPRGNNA